MEVALISPSPPDLYAPGVRILSAYLKAHGHRTKLFFLAGGTEKLRFGGQFVYRYHEKLLDQVAQLTRDSGLIGVSFMTQYFDRALQLTLHLKNRTGAPIIWGGIHPTLCPEEAIRYADMVCLGEGEETLLELANRIERGEPYTETKNIWTQRDGRVIRNEIRPLISRLDDLPFQDYDFQDQYAYDPVADKIIPVTGEMFGNLFSLARDLDGRLKPSYKIMTTRGCPLNCAYCASSVLKNRYYPKGYVRHRSVDNVIAELKEVISKFPDIKIIQFFDDILFSLSKKYIKELASRYKKEIGLPFYGQASATTLDEEKLKCLLDAGLIWVEMGIQTGSDRINRIYDRKVSKYQVLRSANLLKKYKRQMLSPCYHVILDSPWETQDDVLETLGLIMRLPRPYWIKLASLVLFPKTAVYERAKADGLLYNDIEQIYRKPFVYVSASYLNFLVYLSGYCYFPRWLLKVLSKPGMVNIFERNRFSPLVSAMYREAEILRRVGRATRSALQGDLPRLTARARFFLRAKHS